MKRFARRTLIMAAMLVVLLSAAVAFAVWTSQGVGSGNARAVSAQTVTVNASTGPADLYPGGSGALYFTLTNPNPYPITFTAGSLGAVTSSDPTNCPAGNLSGNGPFSGLSLPVAANGTSPQESIAGAVTLAHGAPDGCQGVVFTVAVTLTGTQN